MRRLIRALRRSAAWLWVRVLVKLKVGLQRLGVPRRADVFFGCTWGWRYPVFLYLGLRDDHVVECRQPDLPFFAELAPVRRFLFGVRAIRAGEPPTAPVVIEPPEAPVAGPVPRRVRISYDWYGPPPAHDGPVLTLPYFCHPDFYRLRLHEAARARRDGPRPIRLAFAGTADDDKYERRFAHPLASRPAILRTLLAVAPERTTVVRARRDMPAWEAGARRDILLAISADTREEPERLLDLREYFSLLAHSQFFVAPPGWYMPHSHNLVEAMAVGAIPLTNYGHLMTPPLRDGVDCVAFGSLDELAAATRRILAMGEEEVAAMRRNVVAYYERHLAPESFAPAFRAIDAPEAVLRVNAERVA